MTEREQDEVRFEQGVEYLIDKISCMIRFNTIILWPQSYPTKLSSHLVGGGRTTMNIGDEVVFAGTADQLKLSGEVTPDTPLFKFGQEIKERYHLNENDLLAFDSQVRLKKKNT